jgi:hypothetical protein
MISIERVREMALSFPEAVELDHFGKPSFRIGKKIFATLHVDTNRAVLKLSLVEQSTFAAFNNSIMYPVKGSWGKQGWTYVELSKVRSSVFKDALTTAYHTVAPTNPTKKSGKASR